VNVLTAGDASILSISRLVAGGDGLGFIDGKAVFVPGVLPGERVRIRVARRRKDYDRGALLEVLEPSPHRVTPGCRYAGVCGGCDWLHIRYEEQLRQKASITAEALRRTGGIDRPEPGIEPSEPWGARNRAQLHVSEGGALGYMGAGSTRVVAVDACPIVAPALQRLFRGEAARPPGLERFTVFGAGSGAAEVLAMEGRDDDRELAVTVCGRRILFSVGCFFQSNLPVLEKLVTWALAGLEGGTAADLYSGVGLFASFLSERFSRIICVESSAMSISFARRNVPGTSHEFYPMSVEQWTTTSAGREALDAAVVDPPRAGLGPEVRQWLAEKGPRKLLYVSCNPVTLARDLAGLAAGGYAVDDVRLFDFYPQTSHIEAAVKLSRGGS
jgi:23S rRNA (uracil1939-C5)-methyltransferase